MTNPLPELLAAFRGQCPISDKVYASLCCGRLFIGVEPATGCRTCVSKPKVFGLTLEGANNLEECWENLSNG